MKHILRLIIFAVIAFIVLKSSTIGWRFSSKLMIDFSKNIQLAEKLKSHIYKLSHEIGCRSMFEYKNMERTAEYITEQLTSFGYNVTFQEYVTSGKKAKNIIATKIGTQKPEEIVIVGAHYDTCFNPGADDNASAVAGLLELARIMSAETALRTIKFIAFVNEEPPFFKTENMGSRVYTRAVKKKAENIKAVLILEMIGYYSDKPFSQLYPPFFGPFYPNKGNFVGIVGNFSSRWLIKKAASSFKRQTPFPVESVTTFAFIPGVDFSDHWSFWKEGYPAIMITDTAFYRNPNYHSDTDTYEKLDYESMAEVIKGLKAVIIDLVK